jgi:hypothetical protein
MKQLIMLEAVDGPSVQDLLSKTFSPFLFILTIFYYLFYLSLFFTYN